MSFQNPFRKTQYSTAPNETARPATPAEMQETQEHFARAQESGLTDAQAKEILVINAKFEDGGEYAKLSERLDSLQGEIDAMRALPDGTDEKARAAYAIQDKVTSNEWMYMYNKPVSLWNSSEDSVRERLLEHPQFSEMLEKLDSLEEKAQRVVAEAKSLYGPVAEERDRQKEAA